MKYQASAQQLRLYRQQIADIRQKMRAVHQCIEPEPVQDYEFECENGPVRLSALFGAQASLYVIHNMGSHCAYCTLWADGYNGVYRHLVTRAAFVVATPDAPEVQRAFAQSRSWQFPMVSHRRSSFASDMGYRTTGGKYLPGVSVFQKHSSGVVRVSDATSQPLDDFNPLWHLLEMLPEGPGQWQPRISYPQSARVGS